MIRILLLFFTVSPSATIDYKLPSFIRPCKYGWDWNQCALAIGNEAIPFLATGSQTLPRIDPLRMANVRVIEDQYSRVLRLNMTFKDMYAWGLGKSQLQKSDINMQYKFMAWSLYVPSIYFGFKYEMSGLVKSTVLTGKGNGGLEFYNVGLYYSMYFDLLNFDGIYYIDIVHTDVRVAPQNLKITLDPQFNGSNMLGSGISSLLTEYNEELKRILVPPFNQSFLFSLKPIVDYILSVAPFKTLFPD